MSSVDFDTLQSFGDKIEQNRKVPSNILCYRNKNQRNDFSFRLLRFQLHILLQKIHKKCRYNARKCQIKIQAYLSPYIVKTISSFSERSCRPIVPKTNHKKLKERRICIGNTVIFFRRWKKYQIKPNSQNQCSGYGLYYFQSKNQCQRKYQPRKSIWDMPIKYDDKKR